MMKKVLIILAARQGSSWIVEQIDSILRQRDVLLELVISDDLSTDDTRDQIAKYSADPRVKFLRRQSCSGSAAQHFFWLIKRTNAADFDFVSFADQDDIWNEDKLARACNSLSATGSAGYSSAVTAFWNNGKTTVLRQSSARTVSDFLFEGAGQGCTFVLTAATYQLVREFLARGTTDTERIHYHDWAIYALTRAWGLTWQFDPIPSMQYRQHGHNDTGARASLSGIQKRVSLIRSGWYSHQLSGIAALCRAAAPADSLICQWNSLLRAGQGARRSLGIAAFCIGGGRRRFIDNAILIMCALLRWI